MARTITDIDAEKAKLARTDAILDDLYAQRDKLKAEIARTAQQWREHYRAQLEEVARTHPHLPRAEIALALAVALENGERDVTAQEVAARMTVN